MEFYKELNKMRQDLEGIEEIPLTISEERRILKRVHHQILPKKRKKKWLGIGLSSTYS